MWRYTRIRQTTFVALLSSSVLLGLVLSRIGIELYGSVWLVCAVLLWVCTFKKQLWAVLPLILAGLILGAWRGSEVGAQIQQYDGYFTKQVQVSGVVHEDPMKDGPDMTTLILGDVSINDVDMTGEIRITSRSEIGLKRGDVITVEGKLKEGFGSYQASIGYAEIRTVVRGDDPVMQVREGFAGGVRNALEEPQAALGLGFVIGERSALPQELDEQLKLVGLTHIVVASGYNLTILVRLAKRLFAGISKYLTMLSSVLLMAGFLLVTGFSPSMTRAGLVTGLVVWAWYYGRVIHPLVLILFAAAVTAFVYPVYVWSDVGWYLSFLSFAGVLLLAPLIQRALFGAREVPLLGQVAIETISAQAATLPLILFIFGKLATLSLIANVLVVPFVPFAMLGTFLAGVAGVIVPAAAPWAAWPADYIISYMIAVVGALAGIEWAQLDVTIGIIGLVAIVAVMTAGGLLLWRKLRYDYLQRSIID